MANTILHKRSATAAKVPQTSDLQLGEIAINTYDGKLYIKKNDGSESIVEIGGLDGDITLTGDLTVPTLNATAVKADNMPGRNLIINGGFDVWQRGTSTSSAGYLADRWPCITGGTGFSQQRDTGPGGSFYSLKLAGTVTTAQALRFSQKIEGQNAAHFHNREFTVSFKMRSANGEGHPVLYIGYPPSLDTHVGTEYPIGNVFSSLPNTDWQTYTYTFTMIQSSSSYTCANGIDFIIDYIPDTNGAREVQIADVQLELGPIATEFEREDIGTTLAKCQRYFELLSVDVRWRAEAASAVHVFPLKFLTQKRTQPTITTKTVGSVSNVTGSFPANYLTDQGTGLQCVAGGVGSSWILGWIYNVDAEL